MKFKNPVSVVSPTEGEHATNKDYVDSKQKEISWADYQALPEEEQNNGTLYIIPDMPVEYSDTDTDENNADNKQKTISWADYQSLSEAEQKDGTLYAIPDMPTNNSASIEDTPLTTKEFSTCGLTGKVEYMIANGVCYYEIYANAPSNTDSDTEDEVGIFFPKSKKGFTNSMRNTNGVETQVFNIFVDTDGQIDAQLIGEPVNVNQYFRGYGSYPVAE